MLALPFDGKNSPGIPFKLNAASSQTSGLVAWWPALGQSRGILQNYASGAFASTFFADTALVPRDVVGQAWSFDGSGDRIEITHDALLRPPQRTVAAWVYFNAFTGTHTIAKKDNDWILRVDAATLQFYCWSGGSPQSAQSASISSAVWFHACGTWDGSVITLYKNGLSLATTGASGAASSGTSNVGIGAQPGDGENLAGYIGDIRIYNRALSPGEVMNLWLPQTRWDLYQPLLPTAFYVPTVAAGDQPMMARGRLVPGMRPVFGGGW